MWTMPNTIAMGHDRATILSIAVSNELSTNHIHWKLIQCKDVLEIVMELVGSIDMKQTDPCFNLMVQYKIETISDMVLITAKQRIIETLVFISGLIQQIVSHRMADTLNESYNM
jgi:hypothetical protein